MSQFLLPGGELSIPSEPLDSVDQQPRFAPAALPLEMLEHGVHYAGKLGVTPAVARWHAMKRRFVFEEITLGRQHVRTVAHVADIGTGERFAPLSKTSPNDTCRVSGFAFETAK
jgi:hypothetical protein